MHCLKTGITAILDEVSQKNEAAFQKLISSQKHSKRKTLILFRIPITKKPRSWIHLKNY